MSGSGTIDLGDPNGLNEALETLHKVVRDVLRRLPAPLNARVGLAYVRVPWWDKGKAAGFISTDDLVFRPQVSEWPDHVKMRAVEIERERKQSSALARLFDRADLATVAVGRTIREAIERHDGGGATTSFVSHPFRSGAYDLVAVVEFERGAYERYRAVRTASVRNSGEKLIVGLLDAAVRASLRWYADKLSQDLSERHHAFRRDIDAILRHAGSMMFTDIQTIVSGKLPIGPDLFLALDAISGLTHEGNECQGSILMASMIRIEALQPLRFTDQVSIPECWIGQKIARNGDTSVRCGVGR
jgi:hypothetical protein